jgi:ribose transport system substrate-binding protein
MIKFVGHSHCHQVSAPLAKPLKKKNCTAALAILLLALITITAGQEAASAACEPHAIDLGDGKSVKAGCDQLKIAFLNAATNNVYLQAGMKGAEDAAKAHGAKLQMFDGNWSSETQYNQAQNIISGGEFNAVVAEMLNGNQACKILSEEASAKNIVVSVANQPICGRADKEGEEYWVPGTLNYVGGTQGFEAFRTFIMRIAKDNPGPQKVAVVTGPDLIVQTRAIDAALKEAHEKYPDFVLVAEARTDYSVLQGNQKTLPLLQAHPDLTILIGNYSDITRGEVQAAKQAGMLGKIKIYDSGGSSWAFQAVRDGDIVLTRTYTPYDEMYKSVASLAAAWKGESTPRYVPLESAYVTKENIDQYKPQY